MPEPTAYEIVIRGRASARILRPLVDDFVIDRTQDGRTHLLGAITDSSHLHGVMAHLTSVGAEVVSISPVPSGEPAEPRRPAPAPMIHPPTHTEHPEP